MIFFSNFFSILTFSNFGINLSDESLRNIQIGVLEGVVNIANEITQDHLFVFQLFLIRISME